MGAYTSPGNTRSVRLISASCAKKASATSLADATAPRDLRTARALHPVGRGLRRALLDAVRQRHDESPVEVSVGRGHALRSADAVVDAHQPRRAVRPQVVQQHGAVQVAVQQQLVSAQHRAGDRGGQFLHAGERVHPQRVGRASSVGDGLLQQRRELVVERASLVQQQHRLARFDGDAVPDQVGHARLNVSVRTSRPLCLQSAS